jgi:hypothetical protein
MTLGETQRAFAKTVGEFVVWIFSQPLHEVTFGDAYRSPGQAAANAATGVGIVNSLHCKRLAIDLNLFIGGQYQNDSRAYRAIGEKWKTMHPLARWGGDFVHTPDGNHFSFEWGGVR